MVILNCFNMEEHFYVKSEGNNVFEIVALWIFHLMHSVNLNETCISEETRISVKARSGPDNLIQTRGSYLHLHCLFCRCFCCHSVPSWWSMCEENYFTAESELNPPPRHRKISMYVFVFSLFQLASNNYFCSKQNFWISLIILFCYEWSHVLYFVL